MVAKINKILDNSEAIVEIGNVRKNINLGILGDEVKIDDYVLIHTGFAVAKIDEEKAMSILFAYEQTKD